MVARKVQRTSIECSNKSSGETPDHKLISHRGFNLISGIHSPEVVDKIQNFEIRDSDVFVITYPKSGTIWMQQILSLIEVKGDVTATSNQLNSERMPWIEVSDSEKQFVSAPSPRFRVSHLSYKFMPLELKQKKGKVIYVARNPKDVLVSYYHFHKYANMLETPKDFDDFFEKFMKGNVYGNCWFEHVKNWYSHKDEMNFLYITYEEMIKDLRSVVERITSFLGRDLTPQQLNEVVEHSTFKNMKNNPQANYQLVSITMLNHEQGAFMRKGIIGDWRNYFTVAQNERFDEAYQQKMKDVPLSFIWDMNDPITS
ncbi:amine sulfotransferase-like isoform X2 [Ctenopharyngodon idella]|uniref:amine sulfotransferase-like isoform X2 n=1 Tax=Ctenopharyngodon idella TaxID=7959 RepID=UPI00222F0D65|nr:amine sulfotransferase-like isoform X2 [Ctenopharyngodon idella]